MKYVLPVIGAVAASWLVVHAQEVPFTMFFTGRAAAILPLTGTEQLLVVQGGVLKTVPVSSFCINNCLTAN